MYKYLMVNPEDYRPDNKNHEVLQVKEENGVCYAYVNGVLDFKIDSTVNLWMNVHNYKIGTAYPGIQDFKGLVDQFRVFNRMLSTEERNILFTEKALIL